MGRRKVPSRTDLHNKRRPATRQAKDKQNFDLTIQVLFCLQKLQQLPRGISSDVPGIRQDCTMSTRFLIRWKILKLGWFKVFSLRALSLNSDHRVISN